MKGRQQELLAFWKETKHISERYLNGQITGQDFVDKFINLYRGSNYRNDEMADFFSDIHLYSSDAKNNDFDDQLFDDEQLKVMVKEVNRYVNQKLNSS